MIFDQLSCKFDPKTLACTGAKTDACLTMEQAVAVEKGLPARRTRAAGRSIPGSSTTPASPPRRAFPACCTAG